jgi:hypothetical protein
MPNRIIRDAILASERVASLGWPEEVFYRRLHSVVDDYGRYEANPQLLRARCYPLQTDSVRAADITRWLASCQKAGLILGYEVAGKSYLEVLNFGQQQRSASKFPPPPAVASNCLQAPSDAHLDVSVSVSVSEVVSAKPAAPAFVLPEWIPSETWDAYCKVRTGKKAKNEPHALGLIVKDLETFRSAGHDPVTVLNNSIKSGWAGVFEPKTVGRLSVVGVTVPSAPGRDPALQKLDDDARITKPPTLETLARLAEIRNRVGAQA